MGFNKVYQCLSDIFPQVDSRILKAVAIENSKDVDAAAEIVLSEILPYLSKRSIAAASSTRNQSPQVRLNEAVDEEESNQLRRRKVLLGKRALVETNEVVRDSSATGASSSVDSLEAPNGATTSKFHESTNNEAANVETEELILLGNPHGKGAEIGKDKSGVSLNASEIENSLLRGNLEIKESGSFSKDQSIDIEDLSRSPFTLVDDSICTFLLEDTGSSGRRNDYSNFDGPVDLNADICRNNSINGTIVGDQNAVAQLVPSSSEEQILEAPRAFIRSESGSVSLVDYSSSLVENTGRSGSRDDCSNFDGPVDLNVDICRSSSINGTMVEEQKVAALPLSQEQILESPRACLHSESGSVIHSTSSEKHERGSVEVKSQQGSISEMGDIEDDTFNPSVSRSSQTCRTDLLEEIVEDAKSYKKTLFLAMESIMNLMREVELQEEAAEQAKEEAARGGLDILVKVEELKQMLPHAKEANDMHAGEVYGEKAILATEMRELQSRLLSLSEERDKSLAILDEMRQTLVARQAAAEEVMKTAEQEKLEKEESARNALAEQEAIMMKVVEESKILRQEAEENSKLREFLMDRGQIVDSLQGEISVICEDVRLLKEKFDERVPLSQSISSSQTSCILASGSSLKSITDLGSEQGDTAKTPEKRSPTPSINGQSPKSRSSEERCQADGKELSVDDDWEIFDAVAEF